MIRRIFGILYDCVKRRPLVVACAAYDALKLSFLPRDARSAKRGIAIVSRPSVRPSVRLSVTLMYPGHKSWTSSKVITRIISLGSSLLGAATTAICHHLDHSYDIIGHMSDMTIKFMMYCFLQVFNLKQPPFSHNCRRMEPEKL